jgi:beta-galactosidase/beta-glucuronidase
MKKLTSILVLLVIAASMYSQPKPDGESGTVLMRSSAVAVSEYDEVKEEWGDFTEWMKVDITILINYDDRVVSIDNKWNDHFYIRYVSNDPENKKDDDGESFKQYEFDCYDQDNTQCVLIIAIWDDINFIKVCASYSNINYIYRGKVIN